MRKVFERVIVEREVDAPDDLITLGAAAQVSGIPIKRLSRLVAEGHLPSYRDPAAPNPRRGARLVRAADVREMLRPIFVDGQGAADE